MSTANKPLAATGTAKSVAEPTYHSLSGIQAHLRRLLEPALKATFWLRAELATVNERSGVVYTELVEANSARGGAVIARMRCAIWSNDLARIRARFARAGLGLDLVPGTVIGIQCTVSFHDVHGLALRGLDMDPAFVLGELEMRRRRILEALKREGLLGLNAKRAVPLIPNRILLITSSSGAAYHDFVRALDGRCSVRVLLANSIVQGPKTEESVLKALGLAEVLGVHLVVLIRGGGSKLDLGALDSEAIARRIAALAVPVWTGIGHETDHSILDEVAAKAFRTPTAAAEALATCFERVERLTREAEVRLRAVAADAHAVQQDRLAHATQGVRSATRRLLSVHKAQLQSESHRLRVRVGERVSQARAETAEAIHRVKQACQGRFATQRSALHIRESVLRTQTDSALRCRVAAAQQTAVRLRALRPVQRLKGERQQLEAMRAALRRCGTQSLCGAGGELRARSTDLRVRVDGRISRARVELAPMDSLLRGGYQKQLAAAQEAQRSAAAGMHRVVANRLARARVELAPRAQRLRAALRCQLEARAAHLNRFRAQLQHAGLRRLREASNALGALRFRLAPQRVLVVVARHLLRLNDWEGALRSRAKARLATQRAQVSPLMLKLIGMVNMRTRPATADLRAMEKQLVSAAHRVLGARRDGLTLAYKGLTSQRVERRLEREYIAIAGSERVLKAHDPQRALERGFSLTLTASGKLVRSVHDVGAGVRITTRLSDGQFEATIRAGDNDER